jgi:hypothetical protein
MELTFIDYMWGKLILVAIIGFIAGLMGWIR